MVSGVEVTSGPILRTIPAVLFVIKTLSLVTHSYSVYFVKKNPSLVLLSYNSYNYTGVHNSRSLPPEICAHCPAELWLLSSCVSARVLLVEKLLALAAGTAVN